MFTVVITEWMKLKRSPIMWLFLCWFFSPSLIFSLPFIDFFSNTHGGMSYIIPFLVTAYLVSREYQDHTMSQFVTYPQGKVKMYFGKMFACMSMFFFYLLFQLISTYVMVRDVHSAIMFLVISPLAVLVSLFLRNIFLGFIAQLGLAWFINGQLDRIQNKQIYISRYNDIQGWMKDFDWTKIKTILHDYFFDTTLNAQYTVGFIVISILSVFLIYVLSKRNVIGG